MDGDSFVDFMILKFERRFKNKYKSWFYNLKMETKEIFDLFERLEKSSLNEISIKQGDMEVVLKKGGELPPVQHLNPHVNMPLPQHYVQGGGPQTQHDQVPKKQSDTEIITSPMVGTFYRAPAPDAPPSAPKG